MANNLSANPLFIDTPSPTPLIRTAYKLLHAELVAGSVTVQDGAGNVLAELAAPGRTGLIGWVNGITVATMTGGPLLIYYL